MKYQGKSETEAHNMAAMSVKGRIQVQATLSAVKEMAGWTIYGGLICMIFVLRSALSQTKIANLVSFFNSNLSVSQCYGYSAGTFITA